MAYDNYENTPFDLDHDGHIDSNEAAYIHDTLYKEEADSSVDIDDDSAGDGWYPTKDERAKHKAEAMDGIRQKMSGQSTKPKWNSFSEMSVQKREDIW